MRLPRLSPISSSAAGHPAETLPLLLLLVVLLLPLTLLLLLLLLLPPLTLLNTLGQPPLNRTTARPNVACSTSSASI